MKIDPIVAVEVGTSFVRVFVGEAREDGGLTISALGECPSIGMRKGEVMAMEAIGTCIESALHQAEEEMDEPIDTILLSLSGSQIDSIRHRGERAIEGEITMEDVDAVLAAAREIVLPPGNQILHSIPGIFHVDGLPCQSPIGLEASRLEVDMLVVHGAAKRMKTVIGALANQKVKVGELYFSGLCAAQAALDVEQKLSGVALIDLGGGTTDFLVYADSAIADAGVLAVGGDHVTNDIAKAFRLSTAAAEDVKRTQAEAMIQATSRTRRFHLPVPEGAAPRMGTLSDLQTVVHVRMEETFQILRDRFRKKGLLQHMNAGIVLTGGGARLRGVDQLAESVFSLPCKIGGPINAKGLSVNLSRPEYATGIGTVLIGHGEAVKAASQGGVWTRIKDWFGVS